MIESLTGQRNTAVGYYSLFNVASGNDNVAIGGRAGYNANAGSTGNVFLGYGAGPSSARAVSNTLYINNSASDTPLIFGDFSAKNVGIGTSSPDSSLVVASNAGTISTVDSFNVSGNSNFLGRRARGTASAPTAVQSGDALVSFAGRGYGTTGWSGGHRGRLTFWAAENWTDAAQGTHFSINTTNIGATSSAEHFRVTAGGNVGIGTTAPVYKLEVNGTIKTTKVLSSGDAEVASTGAFYFGDPATNGSWRIIRSGNNLVFECREVGVWVTKSTMIP
jgi:hypothetical protein